MRKLFTLTVAVGIFLPTLLQSQINSGVITISENPVIDTVYYDCLSGIANVYLQNNITGVDYEIISVQPSSVPLPMPNETGEFYIPGAVSAQFVSYTSACNSVIYDLDFPCSSEPTPFVSFFVTRAGIFRAKLDFRIRPVQIIDYFEIERSQNGINFLPLHQLPPQNSGQGIEQYITYDDNPFRGINYYRVKIVALSGQISYSVIRSIFFGDEVDNNAILYPNPNNGHFFLELKEHPTDVFYEVRNVLGHKFYDGLLLNNIDGIFTLNVLNLADGFYILSYKVGENDSWHPLKFEIIN